MTTYLWKLGPNNGSDKIISWTTFLSSAFSSSNGGGEMFSWFGLVENLPLVYNSLELCRCTSSWSICHECMRIYSIAITHLRACLTTYSRLYKYERRAILTTAARARLGNSSASQQVKEERRRKVWTERWNKFPTSLNKSDFHWLSGGKRKSCMWIVPLMSQQQCSCFTTTAEE